MKKIETKSTVLLKHHLKQLKLPSIERDCEEIAFRCAKENVDHLGFLLQLSERELLEREARAAERRLKYAKFPNLKTLESFDFKAQPSINKMLVNELMRGGYVVNRESIILIGHPGTGKTHPATAFGIKACQMGKKVRFYRVTDLITQMMEAREERTLARMKKLLTSLDVMILDEYGDWPVSRFDSTALEFCWTHLIREVRSLAASKDKAVARYEKRLLKRVRETFSTIHSRNDFSDRV